MCYHGCREFFVNSDDELGKQLTRGQFDKWLVFPVSIGIESYARFVLSRSAALLAVACLGIRRVDVYDEFLPSLWVADDVLQGPGHLGVAGVAVLIGLVEQDVVEKVKLEHV